MTPVPEKKAVTFGDDLEDEAPVEKFSPVELPTPKPPQSTTPTDAEHEVERRLKTKSAVSSGSSLQDASLVLTYLKKNIYDDTGWYF